MHKSHDYEKAEPSQSGKRTVRFERSDTQRHSHTRSAEPSASVKASRYSRGPRRFCLVTVLENVGLLLRHNNLRRH
jgi:hypothetical protein